MTRPLLSRLSVVAGLVLVFAGAPSAALAGPPVVSNAFVQIVNSHVQIPDTDEVVTLEGLLHIVVRVVPLDSGERYFTVYANLPANVSAASSTGEHFVAIGAVRHADTHPGLIIPCILPAGFTLIQADPARAVRTVPPVSFGLNLLLRIAETGEVLEGVASTSTDLGPR